MGKKILFLLLVLTGTISLHAQNGVAIGIDETPVKGALLQLKTEKDQDSDGNQNATQGVGFPRVALVKRDQLQPMYPASEAASLTDAQKNAHKGLVVFNVNEIDAENLAAGLNVWNGEEWVPLSETQRKAEVGFDCSKIRLYGRYFHRTPLTSENYIILPVTVTKKGDYMIIASTTNGYYFQASGVFNSPGDYEIKLEPMGTPASIGTNKVSFSNNGEPIETACDFNITVNSTTLTYRITDCEAIKVYGDYQTRTQMDQFVNYAEIPIEVLIEGTTKWETETVNGIKFVVEQILDAPGETILRATAQGSPKKSGKYTFRFMTDGAIRNQCSFEVEFFSTLGTYADPACKCLDIYEERPDVGNGEYFLVDCLDPDGVTIKTYCDIVNGGYTLVWSFSERTAFSTYAPLNRMTIETAYIFSKDVPRNRVTTENGTINYSDYRLTRKEFQHFPNSVSKPMLKVRICEDPTDMNDPWGLQNYGIVSPRNTSENPIEKTFGAKAHVPSVGKIWGKRWEQRATGGGAYGGLYENTSGQMVNHPYIAFYNNETYTTHWDFGFGGSADLFEVVPDKGASNNKARISMMNNAFGWFGETQPNHHFGKCGGTSASDYDFSTQTCGTGTGTAEMKPHSFNNGQGRYLQWFVK